MTIYEDEDGGFREFATLLKGRPKGMHGHNFFRPHSIRGKGLYNRHQNRDEGFYRQELTCDESFGSNTAGFRKGWRPGNSNAFQPASVPYCANKDSNNIDLSPHINSSRFPKTHRVHHFGFRVDDKRNNQKNLQLFGKRFRGNGHGRNYVRGGFSGGHTCGRGSYFQSVCNYKDAESFKCHRVGWDLQANGSGKEVKNKAFANNSGKRGGKGHYFRGSYKRVAGSRTSKVLQHLTNKVNNEFKNLPNPLPVDVGPAEHLECKNDGDACTVESLEAAKDNGSVCMESAVHCTYVTQSPAYTGCSHAPTLSRSEPQKEGVPSQKDSMIGVGDQSHLERAFISCGGGTRKRRRSSAVRDFPVLSGRLQVSSVKKVIIKTKKRKLNVSEDRVLQGYVQVGSQTDFSLANDVSSSSSTIMKPAYCNLVGSESIIKDCNKSHLGMVEGSLDLVMSDLETTCEVATKTKVDEKFSSAELNCSSLTLSKENGGNEQVLELNAVDNCSSTSLLQKGPVPEDSLDVIEAELSIVTVQNLDENDFQSLENSTVLPSKENGGNEQVLELNAVDNCSSTSLLQKGPVCEDSLDVIEAELPIVTVQNLDENDFQSLEISTVLPSLPTHAKVSKASDVATRVSRHPQPREKLKNRRTDVKAVGGLLNLKSQPNKLIAASTDGSLNHCHVQEKVEVEISFELTKEAGPLIPYQSTDGGNIKNEDFGKRIIHKGGRRAKLFQTSKSFDPSDAAKLSTLGASEGVSDRALVKRTLHEFESVRKALVKSQNAVKRADLDAGSLLRQKGKWRNCNEKIVGEVPGVEVGDQFSFRMEMLIIGLHRQVQAGIDYIPGTKRSNGSPLATSIVSSGGYEDDKDDGNTLIYSGQGGNSIKGNKKQESNQELVRGNLALSNSMKEKTPVRVIRGMTDLASPSSKVYTYDGLYDVVNYAFECGAAGFWVYQFTLTRRPGQPQVGLSFLINLKKKGLSRPNLLLSDISRGQERLPVCVVNEVDEDPAPLHFSYISSIKYPTWYSPLLPESCQCVGVCDEERCSCAVKNGGEFSYNEKGYIVRDKKVVYECGPWCSCSSSCENRVSQKGLRYRLEIFKTKNRGWGVRSLDSIQPGGFICEYTGELLSDSEAEQRVGNDEYLFDLGNDCKSSAIQSDSADFNSNLAVVPATEEVAYTIDAKDLGNVARFINHSCSPNLYAQNVLYDSDDLRFPHVMLFAMENIPPMRELTYDYNYSIDQVRDAQGKVKVKACYCGAQDCQGRLY
ncbi:hypothetical protein L7F22_044459 [Adiantum nelumboides]|nr:hypothetical protein [Adiantum nelumboides]